MAFASRLKELRLRQGLSQNQLAKDAGVSQAIVQRLEAGIRQMDDASVGVVRKLARALHVSVDHLIGQYDTNGHLVPATGDTLENGAPVAVNRCPRCAAVGVA